MPSARCTCCRFKTKVAVKWCDTTQHWQVLPETPQTHYVFDSGLVFGCFSFKNLLLFPYSSQLPHSVMSEPTVAFQTDKAENQIQHPEATATVSWLPGSHEGTGNQHQHSSCPMSSHSADTKGQVKGPWKCLRKCHQAYNQNTLQPPIQSPW